MSFIKGKRTLSVNVSKFNVVLSHILNAKIALAAACIILIGCEDRSSNLKKVDSMKEYRWRITESAPKEYVTQIIDGHFEAVDGYLKGVPTRALVHKGWGKGRSNIASGREEIPLPKRFEVAWFSWREDKFYQANFELPFERIQQLVELDRRTPYTLYEHPTSTFTLGLAPGGFTVVWLSSGLHRKVVFQGQAEEFEGVPWSEIFSNPEFTKEEIVEDVIEESLALVPNSPQLNDPGYWKRLHEEVYEYDIVIESEYTPYLISTAFNNGERHKYYSDAKNWKATPLSMLENISVNFFFSDEVRMADLESINTDKMYEAFRALSQENDSPLRVVLKIDGSLLEGEFTTNLRVENDEGSIKITDYKFGRFGGKDRIDTIKESKELMRYMNYPGKPAQP